MVVVSLPGAGHASTVCPAGCTYTTIQAALNNAENGETITVTEPGTYTESNVRAVFGKTGITLTSKNPNAPETFIIDGASGNTVVKMGGIELLEGFTITGGSPGGVLVQGGAPTIRHCIIRNNTTSLSGGGILNTTGSSDLTVENTLIHNNHANKGGGILTVDSLNLIDSQVFENEAVRTAGKAPIAGGISVDGALYIKNSQIFNNQVIGTGGSAGGIAVSGNQATIDTSSISGNSVDSGEAGGLRASSSSVVEMIGGSISGNIAATTGGGVSLTGGSTRVTFLGVSVSGNQAGTSGGGIWCSTSLNLVSFSGSLGGNTGGDLGGACATPQCTPGEIDTTCSTGLPGACSDGSKVCSDSGLWSECVSKFTPFPKELTCDDGIDEDCDGTTDLVSSLEDEDCQSVQPTTPAEVEKSGDDGDPVNTLTGALFQEFPPDLDLGGPLPVAFSRYYASGLAALGISGRLGTNWRHTYEWSLVDNTGTTGFVEITSPQGRRISFELVSSSFELRPTP
jgi:predicted outer membrane repeat protein